MEGKYDKSFELLNDGKMTIPVEGKPFGLVHLVSDKSSEGTDYDEIPHIMELIANNIVLKSSHLYVSSNSGWDNIEDQLVSVDVLQDTGTQPKYLGLGYAEMRYDTKMISDFYETKLNSELCDFIIDSNNRESEQSLEQKVVVWGIKEDDSDDVIDQLLPLNSFTPLVLDGDGYDGTNTRSSLEANAEAHLSHQIQSLKQKSASNLQTIQETIINNIVNDLLNNDACLLNTGGIKTTIDAIDKLLSEPFIKRYVFQMNNEIENNFSAHEKGLRHLISTITTRIKEELKDLSKAQESYIFVRKGNCSPIIESLVSSYNKLISYYLEQIRREDAKQFYAKLTTELEKLKTKLSTFKAKVENCKGYFQSYCIEVENAIERETLKPFVLDLHKDKITNFRIPQDNSINLALFLDKTHLKLVDLFDISEDVIKEKIGNYVKNTSEIQDIKSDSLTKYLNTISKEDVVENLKTIKDMAHPLMQVDRGRFNFNVEYEEKVLWGVGSKDDKIYELIGNSIESTKPEYINTDDHSFLMLSTLHFPAPISALTNMQRYYDDYMNQLSSVSFDVDKRVREAMDNERFHLVPKDKAREKTIFAWIFGLILHKLTDGDKGIYRKGTGKFFIKTNQASRADKHWMDLETPWRTAAFEKFIEKNFEDEILKKIKNHLESIGGDKVQELINEIKENYSETYISKYSYLNKSWEALKSSKDPRDKDVAELIELELDFLNSLSVESINDYI